MEVHAKHSVVSLCLAGILGKLYVAQNTKPNSIRIHIYIYVNLVCFALKIDRSLLCIYIYMYVYFGGDVYVVFPITKS